MALYTCVKIAPEENAAMKVKYDLKYKTTIHSVNPPCHNPYASMGRYIREQVRSTLSLNDT